MFTSPFCDIAYQWKDIHAMRCLNQVVTKYVLQNISDDYGGGIYIGGIIFYEYYTNTIQSVK